MATRPAPRRSTRDERRFLAEVRKAAKDNSISMTDVYNYERGKQDEFNKGIQDARSLEGMITPTPQRIDLDLTQSRSLEGLMNKSSEGRGLAEIMGRPGNVDILYKSGDAYYPARNESVAQNLTDMAKFVKDNPRLSAETTALGTLGTFARLSGQGSAVGDYLYNNAEDAGIRRGTIQAMRGEFEKPAGFMDAVDALTYATPGSVLKIGSKFIKGSMQAAKAGKAISGMAIGSKPARVATGLAAGAGAYAAYNEANPSEADAASLSKFVDLLENQGEEAARAYARKQAKAITSRHRRRVFNRAYGEGAPRPRGVGWYNDPEYAGLGLDERVTTDQIFNDFMSWYKAAKKGSPVARQLLDLPTSDYNALHFGHNKKALSQGGSLAEGRFIPGETNLKQGSQGQVAFVKRYAEKNNLTYEAAAKRLGFNLNP